MQYMLLFDANKFFKRQGESAKDQLEMLREEHRFQDSDVMYVIMSMDKNNILYSYGSMYDSAEHKYSNLDLEPSHKSEPF